MDPTRNVSPKGVSGVLGAEDANCLQATRPSDEAASNNNAPATQRKQSLRRQQDAAAATSKLGAGQQQAESQSSGQRKQMFSLKQLALNSRNLTRRRLGDGPTLAQTTAAAAKKAQHKEPAREVQLNSSSSLSESSEAGSGRRRPPIGSTQEATGRSSYENAPTTSDSCQSDDCEDEKGGGDDEDKSTKKVVSQLEEESSFGSSDEDTDEEEEEDDDDDDDDIEDDVELDDDDGDENEKPAIGAAASPKKQQSKTRRQLRRLAGGRRTSSCRCEPISSQLDFDGLPVTDVDLVTYKHLCQLEQQTHRMHTNLRRPNKQQVSSFVGTGQQRKPPATSVRSCGRQQPANTTDRGKLAAPVSAAAAAASPQLRRSSLQEESGAYYELCTSEAEQRIRQKYVWFPPALADVEQVDAFFEHFARDKIPYLTSTAARPAESSSAMEAPAAATASSGPTSAPRSPHPATASLASSYRDEQISFQLPRQDISLDYCSYQMDEQSRQAYKQFVDKRNSNALDVGTVVQVRYGLGGASERQPDSSSSSSRVPASQQGKTSTASQLNAPAQANPLQRCRRCLVRFDEGQLAVVAPNFVIGTKLYGNSNAAPPTAQIVASSAAATRRRRASTVSMRQLAENTTCCLNLTGAGRITPELDSDPTTASSTRALFHPQCFTCSTCKEFLVDLVYCLRDNKLYCLRHYGESLRPRCNWCQEVSRKVQCARVQAVHRFCLRASCAARVGTRVLAVRAARWRRSACDRRRCRHTQTDTHTSRLRQLPYSLYPICILFGSGKINHLRNTFLVSV